MAEKKPVPKKPVPAGFGALKIPRPAGAAAPSKPVLSKEERKELRKWLDRQAQRAVSSGGLLHGPGGEGVGSLELINRLRYDPELAIRVREWLEQNPGQPGLPGAAPSTTERQTELFRAFPELYQQYVAATGKSIIYDSVGNPVRVVDPNKYFGLREGDEVRVPTLYNRKGEAIPLPVIGQDEKRAPAATDDFALHFGAVPLDGMSDGELGVVQSLLDRRRMRSQFQSTPFDQEDLIGAEEE